MDGLNAEFLRDISFVSDYSNVYGSGILYVEDFDIEESTNTGESVIEACVEPSSLLTLADLEIARDTGRKEGIEDALADAQLTQARSYQAAVQSLAHELQAERLTLEGIASRYADECMRVILAVLQAAVPITLAQQAAFEVAAVVQVLAPRFTCEPDLSVRANPCMSGPLLEVLTGCFPGKATTFSVVGDPALLRGEVQVVWQEGKATRNYCSIWDSIRAVLVSLNLPSFQEVYHADRS